jgi:aspartate aminotransferase, mitochondrial
VQALSGTGACRIAGEFLAQFWPGHRCIYIPVPTWGNHWKIFATSGLETLPYRYYNAVDKRLDFQGLLDDLNTAPNESIILLHACAHNPTGMDPTQAQWQEIARTCLVKRHIVLFDSAYQGFASGDCDADAWSLRYFVKTGIPVMLAQSFAKNFGLYGERCGTFSIVCQSMEERQRVLSQLQAIIRPMYSSPPKHGSLIVKQVFSNEPLRRQYLLECQSMAHRMQAMRSQLVTELIQAGSTLDWSHLLQQIGMFAYTGHVDPTMCDALTKDHSIFLTRDGRISLAGLNQANIARVAAAIHAVTTTTAAVRPADPLASSSVVEASSVMTP